jgi:hypothetical protein
MSPELDEDFRIGRELERKYLTALLDRLAEHERGEITLPALKTAYYSVRDTVSGLVNWNSFNEVMADFETYFKEHEL